jgi:DNA polymerase-3 subunit epsilon
MRQIILDTETTGLNAKLGDRILEVGCVEMVDRRPTGNHFHRYINPERDSEEGALKVHGITTEFLQDKPKFREIAREFLDYIKGAELIIHNAAFDVEFLNAELAMVGMPVIQKHCAGIIDSLRLARELHPGKRNSLDALCERYEVQHGHRTLHGALLDASLLAEVYLAMTRGQNSLAIELEVPRTSLGLAHGLEIVRPALIVVSASADELAAHEQVLAAIDKESKGRCVWLEMSRPPAEGAAPH